MIPIPGRGTGAGIARSRSQDVKQKTTLLVRTGMTLDFYIGDIDIRRFGSQGQQRTAALSLKAAEIELVKNWCAIIRSCSG